MSLLGKLRSLSKREFRRSCNVYCQPKSDQAIIASVYEHGGLTAEKAGGACVFPLADKAALTTGIQAALSQCEYRSHFDYSRRKSTEWPAFLASGLRTVRQFESDFALFGVHGVNQKNFFFEIESPKFGEFGLHLKIIVNANDADFGEAIHYLLDVYRKCKQGR
jgi:hypothetical protein